MRAQIIDMLSNGVLATNVAAALGCDDSYVSQVLAEEGVADQIAANKAARFQDAFVQDKQTDTAEAIALKKVVTLLEFVTKASEAAVVYRILNQATRKVSGAAAAQIPVNQVVAINLPSAAIVQFNLNSEKQVIELDGRSMVTMPARNLVQRLEVEKATRALSLNIPTQLPVTELYRSKDNRPLIEKL